jgi:hypothetical protein
MSLWVYFLAYYAPCSKGEHVSNIWVPPYVLKGFQFDCFSFAWFYFLWFLLQRGWHFFVFEKINLAHVTILLLAYYLES